jgi:hypothetical protein
MHDPIENFQAESGRSDESICTSEGYVQIQFSTRGCSKKIRQSLLKIFRAGVASVFLSEVSLILIIVSSRVVIAMKIFNQGPVDPTHVFNQGSF